MKTIATTTRALAATLLLALTSQAFAQVIQVSGGGDNLRLAINSAPSGATLVVSPGTYDSFDFHSKELTIYAPQRATIVGPAQCDLGTGQGFMRLVNFDVIGDPPTLSDGWIKSAADCAIENCTCALLLIGTEQLGHRTTASISKTVVAGNGASAMILTRCDAAVTDCSLTGGHWDLQGLLIGRPAIITTDSSLRAERVTAIGSSGDYGAEAAVLGMNSRATFADCTLLGALQTPFSPVSCIRADFGSAALLSNTQLQGLPIGNVTAGQLATAEFTTKNWTPGGASQILLRDDPNALASIVLAWDFEPFEVALVDELLFVGSTPNFALWDFGVSDAQGDLIAAITLPNNPALLYRQLHATGIFVTATPWRATAPIGGLIR